MFGLLDFRSHSKSGPNFFLTIPNAGATQFVKVKNKQNQYTCNCLVQLKLIGVHMCMYAYPSIFEYLDICFLTFEYNKSVMIGDSVYIFLRLIWLTLLRSFLAHLDVTDSHMK